MALTRLGAGSLSAGETAQLYARYVRALALLCECFPYVDEPEYRELIDLLLADARAHYPLDVAGFGGSRQIAPRETAGTP